MSVDHILTGLQAELDDEHEDWRIAHYAAVVGLERLDAGAEIERYIAVYIPTGQHDYITLGLLVKGLLIQAER